MRGDLCLADPLNRSHSLNKGLVGEWSSLPGQQRGSFFRDLAGRNHGSLVNGASWTGAQSRKGGYGYLQLSSGSDQYVNIGNPAALQITGSITIACWYKLTSVTTEQQLVTKDSESGGRAYTFELFDWGGSTDSGINFYINGGSGFGGTTNIAKEHRRPVAGEERFVVGTYDGTTVRVYSNGVEGTPSSSADASIPSATANVMIGRRAYSGFTNPLDGFVDNVMIYNRCLSASEVFRLYRETAAGNPNRWNWYKPWRHEEEQVGGGGGGSTVPVLSHHFRQLGAAG